jgi:hypothetical protein
MKKTYCIFGMCEKSILIEGDYATDYQSFGETGMLLYQISTPFDTEEEAEKELENLINVNGTYIIQKVYTK